MKNIFTHKRDRKRFTQHNMQTMDRRRKNVFYETAQYVVTRLTDLVNTLYFNAGKLRRNVL